jgi:multiple sugar transport system substrate-binding protein
MTTGQAVSTLCRIGCEEIHFMNAVKKLFSNLLRYSIATLLIVSAVALLAFGPRSIDSPPTDRVIVNYWEKWTGKEGEAIQEIVDDFNKTEGLKKGIFVRCLCTSDPEQKTLVSTAGGVPPDIAGLYDLDITQFAARNALLPLDEMAAAHGINSSTYKKVFWDECHYNGTLYGIVVTGVNVGLYYNIDKFKAAGLDPAKPPRTIAELDEYAKKMELLEPSGNIVVAGYLPMEPGWVINYTPYWFGGDWWDQKNRRFNFLDPKVIEAFRWAQSYSVRLGANAVSTYHSGVGNFDSPQNAFFAQTIAMEIQGSFFPNFIRNAAPQLQGHYAAAPFPSNDPSLTDVTTCSADVDCIPRGAKHPKEAFEFLAYLTRQDVAEKLANMHCKISPLTKVTEGFMLHHSNPYIRVFDRLAASPNAHPTPPVPMVPEVNDELLNFTDQLSRLAVTPEQGLAEVQANMQAKYEDLMTELKLRGVEH